MSIAGLDHGGGAWADLVTRAVIVLAVALATWTGWRWLRRASAGTGSDGIRVFLAATGADPADLPATGADPAHLPAGLPAGLPAASRSVRAAAILGAAGATLIAGGGALWVGSSDGRLTRIGGIASGVGCVAVILAAALVVSILRAVERREAVAGRPRDGDRPIVPGPRSPVRMSLAALVLTAVCVLPLAPGAVSVVSVACGLGSGWRCESLEVPVDHAGGNPRPTMMTVTYAVHPAIAPIGGRRVLVIATGGPGSSGIDDGRWMIDALSPRIVEQFDIVTFDARGVGRTDGRDCPIASHWYDEQMATAQTASEFVRACLPEAGVEGMDMRRFGTAETIEDIDAIRAQLGADRVTLYGTSYGSVVAQAYAAAHPDRLAGLVLDAPIDRSIPAPDLWATAAQGFEAAIAGTFAACAADPSCAEALPDPGRARERVYQQLDSGPLTLQVTGPDGKAREVTMTRRDFDDLTLAVMYDRTDRMSYLRALAAVAGGDRRLLLRLRSTFGHSASSSSFAYYATWCADTRASPTARADDLSAYQAEVRRAGVLDPRSEEVADALVPCLYWPYQPAPGGAPAETTSVPTLIFTATSDPVTPVSEARAIAARLPQGRLVETRGGAHGSIGDSCPNERMADFVIDGRLPIAQTSVCPGSIIEPFIPLATSPAVTASDAVLGAVWEIRASPEVLAWDGGDRLTVGCADGGSVTLDPASPVTRVTLTFHDCSWAAQAVLNGTGWMDLLTWNATLKLDSSRGPLRLDAIGDEWHLTGTWDGRAVDERR